VLSKSCTTGIPRHGFVPQAARRRGCLAYYAESAPHVSVAIEIDGLVYKVDDLAARETSRLYPRARRAGRLRTNLPRRKRPRWWRTSSPLSAHRGDHAVAVLRTVARDGVTVTHATLHNQTSWSARMCASATTVIVRRAGDVIPEVVG